MNSVRAAKRRVTCAGPPGRAVATEWVRGRHMIENDTLELVTLKFRRVTDAPPQSVSTQAHTGHGHQEANTTWRGRAHRRVQCDASVRVIAADKELTHSSCSRAHPDPLWLPGTRMTMPTWQPGMLISVAASKCSQNWLSMTRAGRRMLSATCGMQQGVSFKGRRKWCRLPPAARDGPEPRRTHLKRRQCHRTRARRLRQHVQ